MNAYIETYRGVVYPWHCDHLGHLNVMYYTNKFDQGAHHLLHVSKKGSKEPGFDFVDVQHETKFLEEQQSGSLVVIEGGILKIGNKSVTLFQRMKNIETGRTAATTKITCVYFDMKARKATLLPDAIKDNLTRLIVEAPQD